MEGNRLLASNYHSTLNTSLQYRIVTAPSSTVFDTRSNPDLQFKGIPLLGWCKDIQIFAIPVIRQRSDGVQIGEDVPLTFSDCFKCFGERAEVIVNGLSINNQSNLQNYFSILQQLKSQDEDSCLAKLAPVLTADIDDSDNEDVLAQIAYERNWRSKRTGYKRTTNKNINEQRYELFSLKDYCMVKGNEWPAFMFDSFEITV